MIAPDARTHFDQVIHYEMQELDGQLAVSCQLLASEATRNGSLQSSWHITSRAQLASNSLKTRAHFILGQLLRCLAAHGVSLEDDNMQEAADLLKNAIDGQLQILLSRAFQGPGMQGSAMESTRIQAMRAFGQEGPRIIARMITELKLTASASKTRSDQTGTTWNVSGTIGVIQSGNGNHASVQQHFDSGARAEIATVLQDMLQRLNADGGRSIGNHDELRELVTDTKVELEKSPGNGLKIMSGLRAIADTTKFVGSLQPAYEVLKPLLSQFGVHLS